MAYTFYYASSFNQNLNSWNIGAVQSMSGMFSQAASFNQTLCWSITLCGDNYRSNYRHASVRA